MSMLKLMVIIIVFLLTGFQLNAQDKATTKEKEVHLKIVKEANGEKTVIDTVITGDFSDDELQQLLKEYKISVDLEEDIHGHKKHMLIEIDEEHMDGDHKMMVHSGDDSKIIIKHIEEGDSLVHLHASDGQHLIEKHIEIHQETEGDHYVKVIKISDGKEIIIKESKGDEKVYYIKEDGDGEHKTIEVSIEIDGDEVSIEETETIEDDPEASKKKKKAKK